MGGTVPEVDVGVACLLLYLRLHPQWDMALWRFVHQSRSLKSSKWWHPGISKPVLCEGPQISAQQGQARKHSGHGLLNFYTLRTLSQVAAAFDASSSPALSPAVRYLVGTHRIEDTSGITASGPGKRLLKG